MTNAALATSTSHDQLRRQVDEVLAQFLTAKAADWAEPQPHWVFEALRGFVLRPGKRLRPMFCVWGWRGAGGTDSHQSVAAAASLEMFHAFCLIHDDIMDASESRRGLPSMHRVLADLHARSSWRGSALRFGTNLAILCGDLCMAWADEIYQNSGMDPQALRAGYRPLAKMRTEVCMGQFLDLREQACGGTLAGALDVIKYKTAKYTVERPLQIGGTLAGASDELLALYGEIGELLGTAFQLRDDVLGVFGDPAVTGKSNLDDLRDGKPTVIMAIARERAGTKQEQRIRALHGNPRLTEEGGATLRQIILETGALEAVEDMIFQRATAVHDLLRSALMPQTARDGLAELVVCATDRRS